MKHRYDGQIRNIGMHYQRLPLQHFIQLKRCPQLISKKYMEPDIITQKLMSLYTEL